MTGRWEGGGLDELGEIRMDESGVVCGLGLD